MSADFLFKFFSTPIPLPNLRYIAGHDAKSDLKLLLEIATNSRLKQGQDKKVESKQIFYCRSHGKQCFKIEVSFTDDNHYMILDDYQEIRHKNFCEKTGEHPNVIRVYNLMMLKRELIEEFMENEGLNNASPETILQKLSGGNGEYFYCSLVPDIENRRKLKKRFDNIVNITIKKSKETKVEESKDDSKSSIKIKTKRICKNSKLAKTSKATPKENECSNSDKGKNDYYFSTKSKKSMEKEKARRTPKVQSSSSFVFPKDENDMSPEVEINEFEYHIKEDSIFEEEEEEDYFKKNSEKNIGINLFHEIGSQNYWPESENSIAQTLNPNEKSKREDLFVSIRNSIMKTLERKSLFDIDNHIEDGLQ